MIDIKKSDENYSSDLSTTQKKQFIQPLSLPCLFQNLPF